VKLPVALHALSAEKTVTMVTSDDPNSTLGLFRILQPAYYSEHL